MDACLKLHSISHLQLYKLYLTITFFYIVLWGMNSFFKSQAWHSIDNVQLLISCCVVNDFLQNTSFLIQIRVLLECY